MFGVIPFLPKHVDPDRVLPLIVDGQGTLAAPAASSVTVASTGLLSSYVGLILTMGVTVRSVPEYEYTGNIVFSLRINQSPFLDNNRGTWTAQRGSVATPVPVWIRVPLSGLITFTATRTDTPAAQPQTIAFLATGIMWPDTPTCRTDGAKHRV